MMKYISLVLLLFFIVPAVHAQEFEIHYTDTVAYGQPGDFMTIAGEAINLSQTDSLTLRMIRLQNNLPTGNWASLICLGVCAPDWIDTLDWIIPPGDTVATDVNFQTDNTTPGTATAYVKYTTLNGSQVVNQWFIASTELSSIGDDNNQFALEFKLLDNYPNPFNNQTIISVNVNKSSEVLLQVFDVLGREVFSSTQKISAPGKVNFRWGGVNQQNEELSSGIYFYKVSANTNGLVNQSEIKKLTLLR
jgi:hypothetical protein